MRNFSCLLHESLLIQFSSDLNKAVLGLSKVEDSKGENSYETLSLDDW